MEVIRREKVEFLLPFAKIMCILGAFACTGLLLFKCLYFSTWEEKKETIVYSILLVFLLFIWAKCKLDEKNIFHLEILRIDVLVILLAAIRLLGLLFHSGHVLFLLYTYITTPNKIYRALCWPMIMVTAYFKIFYWGDFFTPVIGAGMALFCIKWREKATANLIKD
jgi:hypothetical protein